MQKSLQELVDVIPVCINTSITQNTSKDIPDGSQIDLSKYDRVWILAVAGTLGTGGASVKFYTNDSAAASGQTAYTQWNGSSSVSLDMAFVDADDDKAKVEEIICHGAAGRYLNVEVDAPSGTGDADFTVVAFCVRGQYSAELSTALDTFLTSLTIT